MLAQAVHAVGETLEAKHAPNTHAVVLAVDSESDLVLLAEALTAADIQHALIREPDPPWLHQATVIGLAPVSGDARVRVRRVLGRLPLLKETRS